MYADLTITHKGGYIHTLTATARAKPKKKKKINLHPPPKKKKRPSRHSLTHSFLVDCEGIDVPAVQIDDLVAQPGLLHGPFEVRERGEEDVVVATVWVDVGLAID